MSSNTKTPTLARLNSLPASSPLSSAPSYTDQVNTVPEQDPGWSSFCAVKPLSYELQKQVEIYFEEKLFTQAFEFLSGLNSAHAASLKRSLPLEVPSSECLKLIATLCVHPAFTSRATDQEQHQCSSSAIEYLWNLVKIAGPINLKLAQSFLYRNHETLMKTIYKAANSDEEDEPTKLNIRYAQEDSVFALSADFWNVVGWAMNCSCSGGIQDIRWHYWSRWLELMLYILEMDWEMREEQNTCRESLLWQYIQEADGGNGKARRMLRAVFANATGAAASEFSEIFRSELKPPRTTERGDMKSVAVKVDQEIYGDWLDASDSESDRDIIMTGTDHNPRPTKRARHRAPPPRRTNAGRVGRAIKEEDVDSDSSVQSSTAAEKGLGSVKVVALRLRLLQLLSRASLHASLGEGEFDSDFADPHELFTLFVEFIQHLPLNAFSQVVLPLPGVPLHEQMRIALCEFILQRMVSNYQQTRRSTFDAMTKDRLISQYLPFDATKSKVEYQAKVSLLLESILRQLAQLGSNDWIRDEDVVAAVDNGIDRRLKKAQDILSSRSKRTHDQQEQLAMDMLRESGQRLRCTLLL